MRILRISTTTVMRVKTIICYHRKESIHKFSYYQQKLTLCHKPTYLSFLSGKTNYGSKSIATIIPQDKKQLAIRDRIQQ